MNEHPRHAHSLDTAFSLLLFGLFALLSLMVVLVGVSVYRRVVDQAEIHSNQRTALSYVANKVRAGDAAGAVRVEQRDGYCALVLAEAGYETWIYSDGTSLRELLVTPGDAVTWDSGEQLTPVRAFTVQLDGSLLELRAETPDGRQHTLHVALRSGAR